MLVQINYAYEKYIKNIDRSCVKFKQNSHHNFYKVQLYRDMYFIHIANVPHIKDINLHQHMHFYEILSLQRAALIFRETSETRNIR